MINKLNKALTLKGKSGKEYKFDLSTFYSFDDVKDGFKGHGLYLFTKRSSEGSHKKLYLGMASTLETRFDNHHKKDELIAEGANCLGVYHMNNSTRETRKEAESDLLAANNFTCNDQEN